MPTEPVPPRRPRPQGQCGFSLLEILIGGALLAIALLGHTASIFNEQKLSASERARSTAILTVEQFLERLRSDEEFTTLYERLKVLKLYAEGGAMGPGLPSGALSGFAALSDGRKAFAPEAYYADFVVPSGLRTFHVLVDVPAAPSLADPLGPPVLREDLPLPAFGLPYDLDGDGAIDTDPRDDDYVALPITVTIRWTHSGGGIRVDEMSVSSWLWGYR